MLSVMSTGIFNRPHAGKEDDAMTERERLKNMIGAVNKEIECQQDLLKEYEAKLATLPQEPVRLYYSNDWDYPDMGNILVHTFATGGKDYILRIWASACSEAGIPIAALAAHICAFGAPAHPLAPHMDKVDALVEAVRVWRDNYSGTASENLNTALRTLDAAVKGGAQ